LKKQRGYDGQVAAMRELPARDARYGYVADGLHPAVEGVLRGMGIEHLYSHQVAAIEEIRAGHNVVIVTGTASGKTLCYNIPVAEMLAEDPLATALYLFPTKALTQDQLRSIGKFESKEAGINFLAGTYDGDTPQNLRRKIRDNGNVLLTNPDMLHQGILPQHIRWNRFFSHLKYIVIDELHAYRGVFGSNLANVMRRLHRICAHYGSNPQFICCSATIANPREHAESITGRAMSIVDDDGSPRGGKKFVLWNPPEIETAAKGIPGQWRVGGDRRSSLGEAVGLMAKLVEEGVQTITFVRTRLASELVFRDTRERLKHISRKLADSVHAYRGGYLAEDRREIERRLVNKEILGVASTNALELGIDIGSLDACIIVGYPGAIASLWQQAGRAGRGKDESLVILIAQNAPIDQYLMAHSDYLFAQNPEQAVVDPDNPHITIGHVKCAIHELPLSDEEAKIFGEFAPMLLELMDEDKLVKHINDRWYWSHVQYPAAEVSLRNISGPVYTIQDEADGYKVIGTLDEISALSQLFTHAVYLHGAETYFVNKLDIEEKVAFVERRDLDYYTQSVQVSQIRIDEAEEDRVWRGGLLGFGDVTVTTSTPMFKKIKFHSRDSLGFEQLELPAQTLETVAYWFAPPQEMVTEMIRKQFIVAEALVGVANVLLEIAPIFVMCDTQDIGTVVDAACLGRDALFFHDKYPGGMGYARRCLDDIEEMMQTAYTVISECSCKDGCPSCVGSAVPNSAMTDIDSIVRGRIPDKAAAKMLLKMVLGK
jgi:DEAD/DEAH box helicase domain-containing protein